jgi:hypothetical protein
VQPFAQQGERLAQSGDPRTRGAERHAEGGAVGLGVWASAPDAELEPAAAQRLQAGSFPGGLAGLRSRSHGTQVPTRSEVVTAAAAVNVGSGAGVRSVSGSKNVE